MPCLQEHLAKARDYAEAHKMKLKSDALEAWELERWRNKRQADLCQRESKFKHGKAQVRITTESKSSTRWNAHHSSILVLR